MTAGRRRPAGPKPAVSARPLQEDLRGRGRIGFFGRAEAVYENDR